MYTHYFLLLFFHNIDRCIRSRTESPLRRGKEQFYVKRNDNFRNITLLNYKKRMFSVCEKRSYLRCGVNIIFLFLMTFFIYPSPSNPPLCYIYI